MAMSKLVSDWQLGKSKDAMSKMLSIVTNPNQNSDRTSSTFGIPETGVIWGFGFVFVRARDGVMFGRSDLVEELRRKLGEGR